MHVNDSGGNYSTYVRMEHQLQLGGLGPTRLGLAVLHGDRTELSSGDRGLKRSAGLSNVELGCAQFRKE